MWNVSNRSHTETCNINFMSSTQPSASLTAFYIIEQRKQAHHKYYTVLSTYFSMCFIIHGVSWLVDITAGGDFLGLCDQKSSYKHVSYFGRLRSYGHFLIPVHALVWTASHGTSWRVMYSTCRLIFCVASIIFATWLGAVHNRAAAPVAACGGIFENQL